MSDVAVIDTSALGRKRGVRGHPKGRPLDPRAVEEIRALLGDAPIAPGTEALVQLVLDKPIAAAEGDRFVLRDTTAQRTIGGGKFLDVRAPPRKRAPMSLPLAGAKP